MSEFDEDDDWDDPSAEDPYDDDDLEASTIPCPHCASDIYEDAVQCPVCGEYVTRRRSVWSDRPWWWKLVGLAGIVALIAGLVIVTRG